jgi:transaldolase / glucose-6-phosphate isomerase
MADLSEGMTLALGELEPAVQGKLVQLQQQEFSKRLWERDPSLWKTEPAQQKIIRNALGWLTVPQVTLEGLEDLSHFVEKVKAAGFKHAVVLGMGGSSLCPDVCRASFGTAPGFLDLQVLDSTVPANVARLVDPANLSRTLFLVSSKSGGTVETLSFYKHFRDRLKDLKGGLAGENFVAITDPGASLEKLAREEGFRHIFPGQADIGGRFSALSNFGMVPAALAGVDVRALLSRAAEMRRACAADVPVTNNRAITLGVIMAEAARVGRDKVTLVLSPGINTFGDWVEQLIAESTGKEGKGLVPVPERYLADPGAYGNDRLFVYLELISEPDQGLESGLSALEGAGHPVVKIRLRDKLDLGREFYRWELATATAGAVLEINPFDQPNVQESKDNTRRLLAEFRAQGKLTEAAPVMEADDIRFFCDPAALPFLATSAEEHGLATKSLADYLAAFLGLAQPGDYVGLMAYLDFSSLHKALLRALQVQLRDSLYLATTVGFGPRFLHSTGQLHKGGANNGLFIQITCDDPEDVQIPGEPYSFSVLKQAQALGDLAALQGKGRRVIRLHLGADVQAGLDRLMGILKAAIERLRK